MINYYDSKIPLFFGLVVEGVTDGLARAASSPPLFFNFIILLPVYLVHRHGHYNRLDGRGNYLGEEGDISGGGFRIKVRMNLISTKLFSMRKAAVVVKQGFIHES